MGFVRTVGGLLQPFFRSREFYEGLAQFARERGHSALTIETFERAAREARPASACPKPKQLKPVLNDRDAFHPDLVKGSDDTRHR